MTPFSSCTTFCIKNQALLLTLFEAFRQFLTPPLVDDVFAFVNNRGYIFFVHQLFLCGQWPEKKFYSNVPIDARSKKKDFFIVLQFVVSIGIALAYLFTLFH
jgi:hypothetical protein